MDAFRVFRCGCFFVGMVSVLAGSGYAKRWDVLSENEKGVVHGILAHWETWMLARKQEGTAPLIDFEELYAGLSEEGIQFLDRVRSIDPRKNFQFQGARLPPPEGDREFQRIDGQWIQKKGERVKIDPQYLPRKVWEAYEAMMRAMEKDLGRRLYVESGFRSPAYQLYTFLVYIPEHHYSLAETGRWVALPGYSEHGAPERQAVDFINQEGINGDDGDQTPEDFERLPEYRWLWENVRAFGFELSYPRGGRGITFEPWHWRYAPGKKK